MTKQIEELTFLTEGRVRELTTEHQTPFYVYSADVIKKQIKTIISVKMKTPLLIRYAMKANPHLKILQMMKGLGLGIDASSGYEAEHAMRSGFKPQDILLTAQQLPDNLDKLVIKGVQFTATSLHQLEEYGKLFPGSDVSVRINPGIGSGMSGKLTTAGLVSGFGIWYEYLPQVFDIAKKYSLTIRRLHTHIGSGTDSAIWQKVIDINIELLRKMPDVEVLDMGGGFKVGRMAYEKTVNMKEVLSDLDAKVQIFMKDTGRKLTVEIEPGTYLVANAGAIIPEVIDLVDTGKQGYKFIRTNTGMNDILRPVMYGSQQPIVTVKKRIAKNNLKEEYIVIGHNCESGDVLTVEPGNGDKMKSRTLQEVEMGDYLIIGGCGAYCASMSAKGYNGFPNSAEIFIS